MAVTPTSARPRPWRRFALAWLSLSLLGALWAIATPIGAAPDEPAHLVKAASVVRGQFIGEPGSNGLIVQVPGYIADTHAQTCFAFEENITADCAFALPESPTGLVNAPTTAGLYNPLYYLMVGWPSLVIDREVGVYAMRLVSVVIGAAFAAASLVLVSLWRRPTLPALGLLAALTPMVLFLMGTVNPNSLEIVATLTTFVALLTIVKHPDALPRSPLWIIVAVSAAVSANMRGLSLLWVAIAVFAAAMLSGRASARRLLADRSAKYALVVVSAAAIFATIWLLTTNSLGGALVQDEKVTNAPGVGTPVVLGFLWTLTSTIEYSQGMIGIFGWLDTPAPLFVYAVWSVFVGGTIVLAVVLLRGRDFMVSIALITAVVLLPAALQGFYITKGGVIWQGRYILPVFVCAMVFAATALAERVILDRRVSNRLLVAILALWTAAQFLSFAAAIRRYTVGLDAGWLEMLHPNWQPPGGLALSLILFGLTLIGSSIAITRLFRLGRDVPRGPSAFGHHHLDDVHIGT